jgi:hypothetical protein
MQLFAAICWLLRCCCLLRVCAPLVQAAGMSDRVNTRKQACIRTLACCATQLVSCSCLQAVLNTVVCTGFTGFVQHGNTHKYRLQGMSDRIDTREQACTSIFECSAALTVQLRLFAIYSGYCRMHRVCAACLKPGCSLQVHYTDATLSNRCSDVC